MKVTITLPDNVTCGDLLTAAGAVMDASTSFVDWEELHHHNPDAISAPGRVLLDLSHQLTKAAA